jgi:hypothetical protein
MSFFTAVKVTHYATIYILELVLVLYSPNTSRKAGNVRTTGGNYTSICSCNLKSLDSAWEGTVFEIKIIHSIYISLVVYIYIALHVCEVVKHY